MNVEALLVYTVVSFFYVISPGPAIFLAISNGMSGNLHSVLMSSLGNICGLLLISMLSILGLGAIMVTSSTLFMFAKFGGAAYLIYLGIRQLRIRQTLFIENSNLPEAVTRRHSAYFFEGFMLAVSNPKAILFFTALFPQFLNFESAMLPQYLVMTSIFITISFGSLFTYGFISKSAKHLLSTPKSITWFHRISGGLFIGVGIGLTQLKHSA